MFTQRSAHIALVAKRWVLCSIGHMVTSYSVTGALYNLVLLTIVMRKTGTSYLVELLFAYKE